MGPEDSEGRAGGDDSVIARYTYVLDPRQTPLTTLEAVRSTLGGPTLWYSYSTSQLQGQPVSRAQIWLDPFGKVPVRELSHEMQAESLKPGEEAYVERYDVVTLFVHVD